MDLEGSHGLFGPYLPFGPLVVPAMYFAVPRTWAAAPPNHASWPDAPGMKPAMSGRLVPYL